MSDELHRSLGRLEGKLDQVLGNQESFRQKFDAHDNRLRHLEGQSMKALGIITGVTVAFNIIIDGLKHKLFGGS
jgi:hypothetical protein